MGFKIQKSKTVEDGEYNAVLTNIEPAKGAFGPCLKFFFNITGGNYDGTEVSMIRPAKLVPGNKLDKTLQSLGVDTAAVEDDLDVDTLINKAVTVTVEQKTSERGKVFPNVVEVKAAKRVAAAKPVAVVTPKAVAQTVDDVPF
jgi:hypothetical protein